MARKTSLNFKGMNAELSASDSAIDPILTAAKISTLKVEGKDVPATEAPLPIRIAAIGSLLSTGDKTQDSAELITANGQMAAQVTDLDGKLTAATSTISAQTQKISELDGKLLISDASVSRLTAEAGTQSNLLKASTDEVTRLTGLNNGLNAEISKHCLSVNCLTLTDKDGKALSKDATDEQKLEAANKIPVAEKLTALMGAVHSAAAAIGVDIKQIPATASGTPTEKGKKLSADAQCAKHIAEHGAPRLTVQR